MSKILFNDTIIERDEAKIDIEDRAYLFGDGIYEVVAVYNGKLFKMKEHLDRLARSAKEIKITLPYDTEKIEAKLEELRSVNNLKNGILYFQISRGVAPRIHQFPQPIPNPVFVAYTKEMEQPKTEQGEGVNCLLTEDIRWLRCDIKSLNLLGSVLAKQDAVDNNCYEAILHRNGTVTEGSSTNFFIVKGDTLYTHPANNFILNGITRATVLEICDKLGFTVVEEPYDTKQLFEADEAFISGTYIDVVPVNKINDTMIGKGEPGPVTKKIQQEFEMLIG